MVIDPNIKEDRKKEVLAESLQGLTSEQWREFYWGLILGPPIVSTHVLQYSSPDVWKGTIQTAGEADQAVENWISYIVFKWVKEVLDNTWAPVEKQAFLDSFSISLSCIGDDVLASFLLRAEPHLQQQFSLVASSALSQRLEALKT